jgi:ADP-ribose pyrophosphatase YjhB (NUDIX family)
MDYRFCPKCGEKLESKRVKAIEPDRLVCRECSFVFYLDPRVAAFTISAIDGRIVLLRRGIEPSYGKWVFPGGYVERGERVEDAAIRETKEEVNLDVKIKDLLGVYSHNGHPVIIIVYAADVVYGELKACDECLEVKTFFPDEILLDALAFLNTRDALRDYVRK